MISTTDSPYQHISVSGPSLAAVLRGAADWLDEAAANLGEPLFVKATHFEVDTDEDEPWQFSLFIYADEFKGSVEA